MGQNNDNTEHGDLQGNQGGNLSKDPRQHARLRQPEEGFARVSDEEKALRISSNPKSPSPRTPADS